MKVIKWMWKNIVQLNKHVAAYFEHFNDMQRLYNDKNTYVNTNLDVWKLVKITLK